MPVPLVPVSLDFPRAVVRTVGLAAVGHPELEIAVREDLVPAPQLHWLADTLGLPVLAGRLRWEDGDVAPLGWTDVAMALRGDVLVVRAFSFAGGGFVDDATPLLEPLAAMNRLLEAHDLLDRGSWPSGHDRYRGVEGPGPLHGLRGEPSEGDSGWTFTGPGLADGSLHALVTAVPALLPALALPAGAELVLDDEGLSVRA